MDFIRKIYNDLLIWKRSKNKKPLIIDGLRQTGKTYIAKKFGEEQYDNYVLFDFRYDKSLNNIFINAKDNKMSVDTIIEGARLHFPNMDFNPGKTLLIFDEINDSPLARESLKIFAQDERYDIISTGSLLGLSNFNSRNNPVGYTNHLTLKALDFEEFLWANGISNQSIQKIEQEFNETNIISENTMNVLYSYFIRYIVIGGMPAVLSKFLENNDVIAARQVANDLIKDYISDFGKRYNNQNQLIIDPTLYIRIMRAFDSIPDQLAKENKKFKYSEIKKGGRSSEFSDALEWLEKTGLIVRSFNLRALDLPLHGNQISEEFKVFFADIGLLLSIYPLSVTQDIFNNNLGVYKGAIFEAVCADMFYKANYNLYYYADSLRHIENDFVIESIDGIDIIECKATNGKMPSAKKLAFDNSNKNLHKIYKLIPKGTGHGEYYESFPHFMLPFFLKRITYMTGSNLVLNVLPKL